MSMNFQEDITEDQQSLIKELFDVKAIDSRTAIIDGNLFDSRVVKNLANELKQPVTIEAHNEGDIKVMRDGTRYQVTPQGWKKLD